MNVFLYVFCLAFLVFHVCELNIIVKKGISCYLIKSVYLWYEREEDFCYMRLVKHITLYQSS